MAEQHKPTRVPAQVGYYCTSDLIEPPDVDFLHSCNLSFSAVTQRRICDRLLAYALSNNYLILGSSEMNGVSWQVYRLNAFSPTKTQSSKSGSALHARSGTAKSRSRPAVGHGGSLHVAHPPQNANANANANTNSHRNSARLSDASRKCLLRRRRQQLSASTCTLRSSERTILRQRLRHARHRTLLTSYLHTSSETDSVCPCQLKCLLLRADSWDFNVFHLDQYSLGRPLLHLALHLFNKHDLLREFSLDYRALIDTFKTIEDGYHPNTAYHNSVHAADVAQAVECLMLDTPLSQHLTPFDKMTLLLSAFAHDVDHPGVNAPFLLKTNHFLSMLVTQPCSVLENHHWRTTAAIIAQTGLFKHFSKELYTSAIDRIRLLILSTDIVRHQEFVTQLTEFVDEGRHIELKTARPSQNDLEMLMQVVIKLGDICNPTRSWELCKRWSSRICTEFFQQGDLERELGLPVTPRFDRSTTSVADTQIGFIDYVVRHSFTLWHSYAGTHLSKQLLENMEDNRRTWEIAKSKQQELLMDESEIVNDHDVKENGNHQPKMTEVLPPTIDNHDSVDLCKNKGDKDKRLLDCERTTPVVNRTAASACCRRCRDDSDCVYDETLAKYLNDRRHSLPNSAIVDMVACAPRNAPPLPENLVESRRRSVPHVPLYGVNGVIKKQRYVGARLTSSKWSTKCWNLASSKEAFAIKEDDVKAEQECQLVPTIQVDEVLCSVVSPTDSIESNSTHDLSSQNEANSPHFLPKQSLTTKLSLQYNVSTSKKKQSVINSPISPVRDLLSRRRHSFPPSLAELARINTRHTLFTSRDGQRWIRKRSRRQANGTANVRRARTVAKADAAKPAQCPVPADPPCSNTQRHDGSPSADHANKEEKSSRLDANSFRLDTTRNFLDTSFASESDSEDDDDDSERLCLPVSPRHRSHSIEFDSARFVGGTMQYLASIGYDMVINVPSLTSGSACA